MAPELVWDELPAGSEQLRVLDPMAGSGTTLVTAKCRGHEVLGFDRDPLAVLISRTWLTPVDSEKALQTGREVLAKSRIMARKIRLSDAYPRNADEETRAFIRFWFDRKNRIQLASLAASISEIQDLPHRNLMWCAFSRLIITKSKGVSRAADISHSRPHRTYQKAPIVAFEHFERSVQRILKAIPFSKPNVIAPTSSVELADARCLPIDDNSVDIVITSPPYLNAIDYVRGHKFSLVWMGYNIGELRNLRSTNIGAEKMGSKTDKDTETDNILNVMCSVDKLTNRQLCILRQYVHDLRSVLSETKRVLRFGGKAIFVIGDCNLRNTFVSNSMCIQGLAKELNMRVDKIRKRPLPENRRYLPPPGALNIGKHLEKRMREEVILTLSRKGNKKSCSTLVH